MPGAELECERVREALLDNSVEGAPMSELPPWAARHLGSCAECERFGRGVRPSYDDLDRGPLYTASLRRRTLAAMAAADEGRVGWLVPWLAPAAAVSIAASFVGPVWLTARWIGPLVSSGWMAWGIALGVCSSLGFAAAGAVLVALADLRAEQAGLDAAGRPAERRPS